MEKPDQQIVEHAKQAGEQASEHAEPGKDSDQDCQQDKINVTESNVSFYSPPHFAYTNAVC